MSFLLREDGRKPARVPNPIALGTKRTLGFGIANCRVLTNCSSTRTSSPCFSWPTTLLFVVDMASRTLTVGTCTCHCAAVACQHAVQFSPHNVRNDRRCGLCSGSASEEGDATTRLTHAKHALLCKAHQSVTGMKQKTRALSALCTCSNRARPCRRRHRRCDRAGPR